MVSKVKITDLGITGTRQGMNKLQQKAFLSVVAKLLERYPMLNTFHQGDCVGVDTQSAKLVKELYDFTVVAHPPVSKKLVGDFKSDQVREDKTYFARNRDIVDESSIMIAITLENEDPSPKLSGTWYTLNYSIKNKKETYHIKPDGSINVFNS